MRVSSSNGSSGDVTWQQHWAHTGRQPPAPTTAGRTLDGQPGVAAAAPQAGDQRGMHLVGPAVWGAGSGRAAAKSALSRWQRNWGEAQPARSQASLPRAPALAELTCRPWGAGRPRSSPPPPGAGRAGGSGTGERAGHRRAPPAASTLRWPARSRQRGWRQGWLAPVPPHNAIQRAEGLGFPAVHRQQCGDVVLRWGGAEEEGDRKNRGRRPSVRQRCRAAGRPFLVELDPQRASSEKQARQDRRSGSPLTQWASNLRRAWGPARVAVRTGRTRCAARQPAAAPGRTRGAPPVPHRHAHMPTRRCARAYWRKTWVSASTSSTWLRSRPNHWGAGRRGGQAGRQAWWAGRQA